MNGLKFVVWGGAAVLAAWLVAGCVAPRAVFLPNEDAPVRAGPHMRGDIYIWTGKEWELSANKVCIPEGFYIWNSGEGRRNLRGANTNSIFAK